MHWLRHCLCGTGSDVAPELSGIVAVPRDSDVEGDLAPGQNGPQPSANAKRLQELQANIAAACDSLAALDCQTWLERLSVSLELLEEAVGVVASLAIFGPGASRSAWVLNGFGQLSLRTGSWLQTLHEKLLQKSPDLLAVVLSSAGPDVPAPGGFSQPWGVALRPLPALVVPGEQIALPIFHAGRVLAAALLLGFTADGRQPPPTSALRQTSTPKAPAATAAASGGGGAAAAAGNGGGGDGHPSSTSGTDGLSPRTRLVGPRSPQQARLRVPSPQTPLSQHLFSPASSRVGNPTSHIYHWKSPSDCARDQHVHLQLQQLGASQRGSEAPPPPPEPWEVGPAAVSELLRLSQILGYGIFTDSGQSRFLAQVAEHVSNLHSSNSLHELVCAVLEAVSALLYEKLQLPAQPLLAATTSPLSGAAAQSAAPVAAAAAAAAAAAGATSGAGGGGGGCGDCSTSASTAGGGGGSPAVLFSWRPNAGLLANIGTGLSPRNILDSNASQPFTFMGAQSSATGAAACLHSPYLYGGGSTSGLGGSGGGPARSAQIDSGAQSRLRRESSVASLRMMGGGGGGGGEQESYGGGSSLGLARLGGGGTGTAAAAAAAAVAAEPSRIKAVRMRLQHTLLIKALRTAAASGTGHGARRISPAVLTAGGGAAAAAASHGIVSPLVDVSSRFGISGTPPTPAFCQAGPMAALVTDLDTSTTTMSRGVYSGGGGGGGGAAGARRIPPLITLVLSDASMHVLEDQTAYRDVLLAGNLLGGVSPGSVIVGTERIPTLPAVQTAGAGVVGLYGGTTVSTTAAALTYDSTAPASTTTTTLVPTQNGDVEDYLYYSHPSTCRPAASGPGGGAAGAIIAVAPAATSSVVSNGYPISAPVTPATMAGATAGAMAPPAVAPALAPPPVHLALYLVFADSLPVGVLNKVAAELQPILALIFSTVRAVLTDASGAGATPHSSGANRIASDWRALYEQLTGKPVGPPATNAGGAATAAAAVTAANPTPIRVPSNPGLRTVSEDDFLLKGNGGNSRRGAAAGCDGGGGGGGCSSPGRRMFLGGVRSSGGGAAAAGGSGPAARPVSQGAPQDCRIPRTFSNGKLQSKQLAAVQRRLGGLMPATPSVGAALLNGSAGSGSGAASAAAGAAAGAGFAAGGGGGGGGGGGDLMDVAPMDLLPDGGTDAEGSQPGSPQRMTSSWLVQSSPDVVLEEASAGPGGGGNSGAGGGAATAAGSALGLPSEVLVNTMRTRLSAAMAVHETSDQARVGIAQDLAAVELMELLGRGGQGVVFRGTLHGLEAAIKVLVQQQQQNPQDDKQQQQQQQQGKQRDGRNDAGGGGGGGGGDADENCGASRELPDTLSRMLKRGAMEVAVASTLSHPNIVQVYAAFSDVVVVRCHYKDSPAPVLRLCTADDPMLAGSDPGPLNQVLCLEFCDAGTLLAVARVGAFRQPCATGAVNGAIWPALVPLYTSLLEVALALRHLHSRRLVHCDVKAANVLLKSSIRDPRGWSCKLSDFGCVRLMNEVSPDGRLGFRMKNPLGTIGYMAPECFMKGMMLGPEVDIYAFGVLMWELLMCKSPYSDVNPQEIPKQVLRANLRPVFHPLAPAPYCALAARCWAGSPRRRPTAWELVSLLEQLLAEARADAARPGPQRPQAAQLPQALQRHPQQQQQQQQQQHHQPQPPSQQQQQQQHHHQPQPPPGPSQQQQQQQQQQLPSSTGLPRAQSPAPCPPGPMPPAAAATAAALRRGGAGGGSAAARPISEPTAPPLMQPGAHLAAGRESVGSDDPRVAAGRANGSAVWAQMPHGSGQGQVQGQGRKLGALASDLAALNQKGDGDGGQAAPQPQPSPPQAPKQQQ